MSQELVEVQGTVQPDGTLVLDEKLTLPPGRVRVTVQPMVQFPMDDPFWQRMQAIWDGQKARGHVPRSKEEIDAELRALRDEAEEEILEAMRLQEECQRARKQGRMAWGKCPDRPPGGER
jgi:hypothetical protein